MPQISHINWISLSILTLIMMLNIHPNPHIQKMPQSKKQMNTKSLKLKW